MNFENPSKCEIIMHELGYALMAGFYRRYARSLGLRGDERVLELGSGGGALSRFLAPLLPEGRLTCVDISAAWMDRARRRLARFDNVEFLCGELADLPIPDGSQDLAVIHLMLHDVPAEKRQPFITTLTGKLTPTGRVAIREPISARHSLPEPELRSLLTTAGLHETSAGHSRNVFMGEMYEGVYGRECAEGLTNAGRGAIIEHMFDMTTGGRSGCPAIVSIQERRRRSPS